MIETGMIVAAIAGITQIGKKLGLPKRFLPLLSAVTGIVLGATFLDGDLKTNLFYGLLLGLGACGAYDQTKLFKKEKFYHD